MDHEPGIDWDASEFWDGPDPHENPWADNRTSVFDSPTELGRESAADPDDRPDGVTAYTFDGADEDAAYAFDGADEVTASGEIGHEVFLGVATGDTDPFSSRGLLRQRYGARSRSDLPASDDGADELVSVIAGRILVAVAIAAVVMLLIGCYALLSVGDDGYVPIAGPALPTTTSTHVATTAVTPTTGASGTAADQSSDDEPADADPSTGAAAGNGSGVAPTAPPAPDSTGTTAPPSTTSTPNRPTSPPTSRTPSSTVPPRDERNDDGFGLLDLLGLG
jgi:hypothetical protein